MKKVIIWVIALMPVPRRISKIKVSTYQPGQYLIDIMPNKSKKVIKNAQSIYNGKSQRLFISAPKESESKKPSIPNINAVINGNIIASLLHTKSLSNKKRKRVFFIVLLCAFPFISPIFLSRNIFLNLGNSFGILDY